MTPTRQYQANIAKSTDRLRTASVGLPILVAFDWTAREFVISRMPQPEIVIARGRFQVVASWIDGYRTGFIAAGIAVILDVMRAADPIDAAILTTSTARLAAATDVSAAVRAALERFEQWQKNQSS